MRDKRTLDKFAKFLLEKIGEKTLRRTDWEMLCQPCSYSRFRTTLQYLLENAYVDRLSRGVYRRTSLGEEALELWKKTYNKEEKS